jgi:hypothetical protein
MDAAEKVKDAATDAAASATMENLKVIFCFDLLLKSQI